jgi:hypothetical protein
MIRLTELCACGLVLLSSADSAQRHAASTASFAAPEIIIFHGGSLAKPVVVASWTENHTLLLSSEPHQPMTPGNPSSRPRPVIKLALFWGTQWRVYVESPSRLATLTPAQANQTGEYLPAVPGARARIRVGTIDGPVSDSGLAVLRRHRIPVRID